MAAPRKAKRRSRKEWTAIHEAGHAIVGVALAIPVHMVTATPHEDASGLAWAELLAPGNAEPSSARPTRRQAIEHMAMSVAGLHAEYRQYALDNGLDEYGFFDPDDPRSAGSASDLDGFYEWAKFLGGDEHTLLEASRQAAKLAQKLTIERWPAIRLLADLLMKESMLFGDHVDRIARHAMPNAWWPIKAVTDTEQYVLGSAKTLEDFKIEWRRVPKRKPRRKRRLTG
jgi:hypothetical protein